MRVGKNKYTVLLITLVVLVVSLVTSAGCSGAYAKRDIKSSITNEHQHKVSVSKYEIINKIAEKTYTTTSAGTPSHTHTFTLVKADFEVLFKKSSVTVVTSPGTDAHTHTFTITGW